MGRARAVGRDVVFNVVWIGDVFRFLYPFVSSLLAHSDARVRFVANGCTPASVEAMHHYASTGDGRVCEVLEVSPDLVIPHGVALDQVLSTRDDGPLFAVIDSDIKATGPFLPDLLRPLNDPADPAVAVTAGRAVWSEPVPAPLDTPWIVGGMFTRADGFVYGSVYAAIYRRDALDAMTQRWSVGFGTGGQGLDIPGTELAPAAAQHLRDNGHPATIFDTGKLVNTFLQFDGHRVVHQEHPALLHVGGVSSHITPMPHGPKIMAKMHADVWRHTGDDLSRLLTEPEARREASIDPKIRPRCSELTAQILIAAHTRQPIPAVPDDLSPAATALLTRLRGEMIDLVERYATP